VTDWPRTYPGESAPEGVLAIARQVMPLLIGGDHPALTVLREQYDHAHITSVEMTGVGFFVDYDVPPDLPKTSPPEIVGGNAELRIAGIEHGAGCVAFVRQGRLQMFEVYTYDGEWPENAQLLSIDSVFPLEVT
jgi:hypothetical protein